MNKDLTVGEPRKVLWMFALPMFLSMIFQQLYNMADSIIVGQFNGETAVGAIGISYPVTMIFMAVAIGANAGCSVVISKLFGSKQYGEMKTAISTSFLSVIVISAVFLIAGLASAAPIIRLLKTPDAIFDDTLSYLNIFILAFPFLFLYSPFYFVMCFKVISDGVLRGTMKMWCFLTSTFSDLLLRVVFAYILVIKFGADGIWLSWPVGWTISTILSLIYYFSGVWHKKRNAKPCKER